MEAHNNNELFQDYTFVYDNEEGLNSSFEPVKTNITINMKVIHRVIALKFIKLGVEFDKLTLPWTNEYREFVQNMRTKDEYGKLNVTELTDLYNNISLNKDSKDTSINFYISMPDLFDDGFFEWVQDNKKLFDFKKKFFEKDFREVVENDYDYNGVDGTNYERFCANFRNAVAQEFKNVMTNFIYCNLTPEELSGLEKDKVICVNVRCRTRKGTVWELSDGLGGHCEKISQYATLDFLKYCLDKHAILTDGGMYVDRCIKKLTDNFDKKFNDVINYCVNNYGEELVSSVDGEDKSELAVAMLIMNKYYDGDLLKDLKNLKGAIKMLQKKFDGNLQDLFGMFIAYKDEEDEESEENEEDGKSSIKGLDTIEDLKEFLRENFSEYGEMNDNEAKNAEMFIKITGKIKDMMDKMSDDEREIVWRVMEKFGSEE